jgi:DNA-binding XRE family transcriptional regulator
MFSRQTNALYVTIRFICLVLSKFFFIGAKKSCHCQRRSEQTPELASKIGVRNSEPLEIAHFLSFRFQSRNMKKNPRNLVGLQIRRLRDQQKLTQPMLAARCRRWGWDLSRQTLAKIETQLRWVSDFELLCLARALRVEPNDLWPSKDKIPRMLEDFFERLSSGVE